MSVPLDFICPRCGLSGAEVQAEVQRQVMVAALLKERDGYRRSGRDQAKEIAAVEAELERAGYSEPKPLRSAQAVA